MPKSYPGFVRFDGGEVSEKVGARFDLDNYEAYLRRMENFILWKTGGAFRRPGSVYVNTQKASDYPARLFPFNYDDDERYIVELTDQPTNYATRMYKGSTHLPCGGIGSETEVSAPFDITTNQEERINRMQSALTPQQKLWFVSEAFRPAEIIRTAACTWTFTDITFTGTGEDLSTKFPRALTFFEDRSVFGGQIDYPMRVQFSESGDYYAFPSTPTTNLDLTLGGEVGVIHWLKALNAVLIGTSKSEHFIASSSGPLTATTAYTRQQSQIGSKFREAHLVGNYVLFPNKSGDRVYEYAYLLDRDVYIPADINVFADSVLKYGIRQSALMTDPLPILWFVTEDYKLVGLVYDRQWNIVGWFRYITDGYVKSIAIIDTDTQDEIWLVVDRGGSNENIEYFKPFEWDQEEDDMFYVDSGITWEGGATSNITGITNGNPPRVTAASHGLVDGDIVRIRDVQGMTEVNETNDGIYKVDQFDVNNFDLYQMDGTTPIDATAWGTYTSGGTCEKVTKDVTGLGHLEGKEVQILADGSSLPEETVSSGAITMDEYGHRIHIGLGYTSTMLLMRFLRGMPGALQRINDVILDFYKTSTCKVGTSLNNLVQIVFHGKKDILGEPLIPVTGLVEKRLPGGHSREGDLYVVADEPLPCNIRGIFPKVDKNERI